MGVRTVLMSGAVATVAAFTILPVAGAAAADLPKSMQLILKELKISDDILAGSEGEHKVPAAWLKDARKQGKVKIVSSWKSKGFEKFTAPFRERYPFIKLENWRGTKYDRGLKPLLAYRSGSHIADVVISIAAFYNQMKAGGALEDLRDLPNFKNLPKPYRDDGGLWIGQKLTYRCITYNTAKVKKSDLPKTWDDLLKGDRWKGGRLALNNYPHSWLLPLWGMKGEDWAKGFVRGLFALSPQFRKEGQTASVSLAAAGEFDAVIMGSGHRTRQYLDKGAPVGFHCPEPVPVGPAQMAMIKGSPRAAASKIFVNWFLSKEGQIAQYWAMAETPVHKDLHRKEFLAFPDQALGKTPAFRYQHLVDTETPKLVKFWNAMWSKGTGGIVERFSGRVKAAKRGGRRIVVDHKGMDRTVKVSGSRTKIVVDGMENDRKAVKVGMTCDIAFLVKDKEAKEMICK